MSLFDRVNELIPGFGRPGLSYRALDGSWPAASIVAKICERVGLGPEYLDFRGLEGSVDGLSLTRKQPAFSGIDALAQVYLFDPSSHGGRLHFIPRGGDPVAYLTLDDLLDSSDAITKAQREDAIEVPRVLHVEYFDTDGGLNPDKQSSDRSLDSRAVEEEVIETQVIMRHADAARWVVIAHKVMIEEQTGEVEFSLPVRWMWLVPGNVIMLDDVRLRITKIELDEGRQNYTCRRDRASTYRSFVQGVAPSPQTPPPDLVMGETVAALLDIPILRDADDRLILYAAYSGTTDNWQGAFVETSVDDGATWGDATMIETGTIMGELLDPLPAASEYIPDSAHQIRVRLYMSDMELTPCTLADMMNRQNRAAIGGEVIQFADAQDLGGNVWEIGYLLRGRLGSDIPAEHAVGTRFVLLTRNTLTAIDVSTQLLGRPIKQRVTSAGGDVSVVYTVDYQGISQRELPVGYLEAERVGGNLVITWQGAGRLGGSAQVTHSPQFAGYRVSVNSVETVTQNQALTVTDPGGAVTIAVTQLNTITGPGPIRSITP